MASTINAITTGTGGIQTTADATGNISLQSNGSNVLNTTASGVSIPGTLGVTGAMTASGGLAVTGTLTVNGVAPGRSGASYINLTTGTTNVTLTSSSNQTQVISCNIADCSITLPDMTTLTKGSGYFVFYNTSAFPVAVKDSGGVIREYLYPVAAGSPIAAVTLNIQENATSAGVWHIHSPISAGTATLANNFVSTSYTISGTLRQVFQISTTQYLFASYSSETSNNTAYVKLGTLNTTTKAFTFGSEITLNSAGASNRWNSLAFDTNGTDRGVLTLSQGTVYNGQTIGFYSYGVAIVSNTLYVSSANSYSMGTTSGAGQDPAVRSLYTGSNNAFYVCSTVGSGANYYFNIVGLKVNVSGTTVSLSEATNSNFNGSNNTSTYYISPTSFTTLVVDVADNSAYYFVSYNTSTNVLTTGTRTTQTTRIAGNLLGNLTSNVSSNNPYQKIVMSGTTRILVGNSMGTIANAGTATVTVSNSTYKYKAFPSTLYSNVVGTISAGVVTPTTIISVSASSYYAYDYTNNALLNFDPSTTDFNFNTAAFTPFGSLQSTVNCYWLNSTNLVTLYVDTANLAIYANIISPAVPFVS